MVTTLTPKERRFVEAYLADERRIASAAALAAGYSPKGAAQGAYRLLRRPRVRAAVEARDLRRPQPAPPADVPAVPAPVVADVRPVSVETAAGARQDPPPLHADGAVSAPIAPTRPRVRDADILGRLASLMTHLRPREQRFVAVYARTRENAAAAAIEAGYSAKTAAQAAYRLLRLPRIRAVIGLVAEHADALMARNVVASSEEVLVTLTRSLRADIRQLYDERGYLKAPDQMPDDIALCVESLDVATHQTEHGESRHEKVKLQSKLRAAELLAKHHRLLGQEAQTPEAPRITIVVERPAPAPPALPAPARPALPDIAGEVVSHE